jgi:hypothetical protein
MNPLRTGWTRAAALASLIRAAGSAGSGRVLTPRTGFSCPGSGKGFGNSTILMGSGGSPESVAGRVLS